MDGGFPDLDPDKLLNGANIRRARKAKKMTKARLGELTGVSERAVYNWEKDIHVPEGHAREKLLEVLDLSLPDGTVGRDRLPRIEQIGTGDRHELELIRAHVEMISMMLDRILGPKS